MADITLEKNLPHNVDAERSILGSVLLENRALNQAQEILREGDFYRDGHRRIFRAMEVLRERSGVIDLITLKNELDRAGDLESVGGPGYIASLVDGVPKSSNVEHYARIVKEKALMRALIEASNRIQALCFEGEMPVQDVLDEAQKQIFSLAEGHLTSGFVPVKELAGPTLEYIDKLHDRQELVTGLATGFERFDELTSGLQPTDLIVLAARPSMGKTAMALNMAQNIATRLGRTVGVFSLEMSKEQLFLRMLCAQARVDAHHLRTGRLGKDEWARLTMAFAELTEAKIFVDDTPGISIFEMRAKARRLKSERGLDLVIVDYLQLMRGRGRYENRTQEVSDISRSLKGLAKELRVPLIALSQLSRAPEQRGGDHKPQLSDLRECVTGETLVQMANGERAPIRSLVGLTPDVVAVDQSGRLVNVASDLVWAVGRRPILRLTLASGRWLRATGRHRLLAPAGWRRVDELRPDDRVALSRITPEPVTTQRWQDARVALLGQMIGDGSYLVHGPMRYTTSSEENCALVADVATREFDCTVKRYEGRRNRHQLLIAGQGNRWHPSGINAWLRGLGIFGQRSYENRVPAGAFRLPNDQIATLLRHLWATDGCIRAGKAGRAHKVRYSSNSPWLASDLAALLLRLGIIARIRRVDQSPCKPSFHVEVPGSSAQRRFLECVGAFGPRVAQALELQQCMSSTSADTNLDTLPAEDFRPVRQPMSALGISRRGMAAIRGTSYGGSARFDSAPSRTLMLEYAELLEDPGLRSRATNDLFWDRVVSVVEEGEEEVYDLTVPGPASWLADGIVSHNSGAIEQDADVVMFIYREEVYRPTEDNRGMARLLIEKQRNGPTGVVDLAFIKEYTKFENLEWRSG